MHWCGIAACPPLPPTSISNSCTPAMHPPSSAVAVPVGRLFQTCIPNATLRGTARMFDSDVAARVPDMIGEISEGVAKALGGRTKMDYIVKLPPTINDARVAGFARGILAEIIGEANVKPDAEPSMGGEDFSLFLNEIPGAYAFIGTNNPAKNATMPHHHPQFNVDEDMFAVGVELAVRFIREWRNEILG